MDEAFKGVQGWTITASARPGEAGKGIVAIKAENAFFGVVIDQQITVDWNSGMEAIDVEMIALALLWKAASALSEECLHLVVLKRNAP